MDTKQANVAVLLSTYNGARFIEPQLRSLKENKTRFTLHWLDDHSTDDTREVLRAAARNLGIDLREWHQEKRQGYPGVFFQLLDCVDADIYLFCDQDDIWQPGKIDVTVANLLPDLGSPVLCFSDPFMFKDSNPEVMHRISELIGDARPPKSQQDSRLFMTFPSVGHTQGLTRPLRELYLRHKEIAREYAFAHDWWMYLIAVAAGKRRLLSDVPTTLYRRHGNNFTEQLINEITAGGFRVASQWRLQQLLRPNVARQAEGFVRAAPTLPQGPKLQRVLELAQLVATTNRRQSLAAVIRLARSGAMWPTKRSAVFFSAACLCSDAPALTP